jgi:hypothetical protein
MKIKLTFLILIIWCALAAQTLNYSVQKPAKLYIGTLFSLNIEIQTSVKDSIFSPQIDTLDVFILKNLKTHDVIDNQTSISTIEMTFQAFDTGEYNFPKIEFAVKSNGEFTYLSTNEFILNIESVIADTTQVIKDIAPPIHLKLGFWDIFLPIVALAVIIGIVFYLSRILKKKSAGQPANIHIDTRPAWQIVREKLQELKAEKLIENEDYLILFFQLSFLLRLFIELHYKVSAVEMTTSEIRHDLKIDPSEKTEILKYLEFADRVKFARFLPSEMEAQNAITWLENYLIGFRTAALPKEETNE